MAEAFTDLTKVLPSIASAKQLSDIAQHAEKICVFADYCRHFMLHKKDDKKAGNLENTICSNEALTTPLVQATKHGLSLLVAQAGTNPAAALKQLQHPEQQQGIWCVQRLCEIITDVYYCFWTRLQKTPEAEGVWTENDKVHSVQTRQLTKISIRTGG